MSTEQTTKIQDKCESEHPTETEKNRYLYTFSKEGACIGISATIYPINKSGECIQRLGYQCGKCNKCYDSIRTNPLVLKYDK